MSDPVLDEARLAAIQAAAEQATPGPWVPKNCADDGDKQPWWWVWQESKLPWYGGVLEIDREPDGTPDFNGGNIGPASITDNKDGEQERCDATFIAMARSAVPELLAHVGVLQADNQRLRDENESFRAVRAELNGADDD